MATKATAQAQPARFSRAKTTFDHSIKDAEQLLEHCESLGHPLPQNAEVFKRAGLVMALTAWETYVEDRVREAVVERFGRDEGQPAQFMRAKLEDELKRFHNPNSEKTGNLFRDYVGLDVTERWKLQHCSAAEAQKKLDELMKKRGDAVHRAKVVSLGAPTAHLVRKEDLEKAIRFLKELVVVTDRALTLSPSPAAPSPD